MNEPQITQRTGELSLSYRSLLSVVIREADLMQTVPSLWCEPQICILEVWDGHKAMDRAPSYHRLESIKLDRSDSIKLLDLKQFPLLSGPPSVAPQQANGHRHSQNLLLPNCVTNPEWQLSLRRRFYLGCFRKGFSSDLLHTTVIKIIATHRRAD